MNMTVNEKPAINEKIEDLNLISLRKYACPKIQSQNDWYLKCIECLGRDGCPAGKRAIEIIETQTKPEQKTQVQKFNDRLQKTLDMVRKSSRSQKFVDAFEKGGDDPAEYLFNLGGYPTKWRARDALKKWLNSHGLTLEDAEVLKRDFRTVSGTNKISSKKAADSRTLKARENIVRLFSGLTTTEEKIRAILENENKDTNTGHTLRNRMCNWKNKYPDLFEKYGLQEVYRIFTLKKMQEMTISGLKIELLKEPVVVSKPAPKPETEDEDDEISIEDFLSETDDTQDTDDEVSDAMPDTETVQKLSEYIDYSGQFLVKEQFDNTLASLRAEYRNGLDQLAKWTGWCEELKNKIETLRSAMEIMGLITEEEHKNDA